MRKLINYVFVVCLLVAFILYQNRGDRIVQAESEQEKRRVFHDKVVYTTDKSPDHKVKDLVFADGETYPFSHIEFDDLVLPGDSMVKTAGSLIYTIYRIEKRDTVTFEAIPPSLWYLNLYKGIKRAIR